MFDICSQSLMRCILLISPFFPSSVTVLGVCLVHFRVPGLSRFGSVFTDLFVEVNLSSNLLPGCLVYLVCKLDNKICSIFGFQGTGSNHFVITSAITS